ncbi:PucR family transcriptional regulator [Tomitella biformata]|uniref:PucR family transcriptional regulator n=1 Tax=Tomitella biformata TaxID=630403 RepID=UPI00046308CA|nr:helix-turn-helix domain-containing protein [Tomitella biformata]
MNPPTQDVGSQVAMEMLSGNFIGNLVQLLRDEITELDDDPVLGRLLEGSVDANIKAAVHFLVTDAEVKDLQVPAAAIAHAQEAARSEIEISLLIRAYRIGHAEFLEAAMSRVSMLQLVDGSLTIIKIVNRAAQYIDKVCKEVEQAYMHERDQWAGSQSGLRWGWVSQLVDGNSVDVAAAERALGYRLDARHLAVCVHIGGLGLRARDSAARESVLRHTRDLLLKHITVTAPPLLVDSTIGESWMWFTVPGDFELDVAAVAQGVVAANVDVRLALGKPAGGAPGFRRSYKSARQVLAVVAAKEDSGPVVAYSQIASVALMAGDIIRLREFVSDVLGDLAADTERSARLRETLCSFLMNGRSFAAASALLNVHRNTIQYRVGQALDVGGLSLADPDEIWNIQIALQACHWLGHSVLRGTEAG